MSDLDDIVSDFLVESHENLDQLDRDLVQLEERPTPEVLGSIFRTIHTVKGTCGFLGFGRLESVAHAGENLLSLLREGAVDVDADITTALLATCDAVRNMLAAIEADGTDGDGDWSALVAELERLQAPSAQPKAAKPKAAPTKAAAKPKAPAKPRKAAPATTDDNGAPVAETPAPAPMAAPAAEPVLEELPVVAHEDVRASTTPAAAPAPAIGSAPTVPAALLTPGGEARSAAVDSSIRVDVDLLDTLMNLVGELVLARNQILQLTGTGANHDAGLAAPAQRLNLITTELQEGVMKTRMQPIGNVWGKFPRVVRDLSVACGKHVRLEMDGAETELDKTIIEAIKDPLTHLVRNAIDHGIETPDRRREIGKAHEGRLTLRAFHEGGRVNIEIIDDGAGIDVEAVRNKAVERRVVAAELAERMSHREVLNLIFVPGFSTAATVSNVSGRGVGMDVVKTNIERIGGSVEVVTEVGVGTTFKISIPLTLAIIPALVVTSGGQRYAIPQISLLELVRLDTTSANRGIESIHGTPVYRLRGRLLPIVDLAAELHGPEHASHANSKGVVNIVVLQADDRHFGLVVDQINDTQEIVVKPLGKLVKDVTTFAGATNMGDGRVALILDVMGLAHRASVVSTAGDRARATDDEQESGTSTQDRQSLLLVAVDGDRRLAVPLSAVARLEEFAPESVEMSGRNQVVQYRGEILPLVDLAGSLGYGFSGISTTGTLQVVVYQHGTQRVGIVVGQIVDIVEETVPPVGTPFVVQGRVTELVDPAMVAGTVVSGIAVETAHSGFETSYVDFDVEQLAEFAMVGSSNGNGVH